MQTGPSSTPLTDRIVANDAIEHNRYNLSVPVRDYLDSLIVLGGALVAMQTDGLCCEPCNAKLAHWWGMSNALSSPERRWMQAKITAVYGSLPNGPWEECQ